MSKRKCRVIPDVGICRETSLVDYCQLHSGRNIHGAFYYSICLYLVCDSGYLVCDEKGDLSLAASSGHYAWFAVAFSLLSILLYFVALCCSHLAAFRTATNMKKRQCTILSRYRLDISVRMPVADFGKLLMTMLD